MSQIACLSPRLRALVALAVLGSSSALAQATPEATERCATRLSIALLGKSPSAALLANANPQATIDQMVASPVFIERFARFVNATFNELPGATAADDSAYHLARYVLQNNRPWEELFIGQYTLNGTGDAVTVAADPAGIGYFRNRAWMTRYAGNEIGGVRIQAAYRMMQNVIGLKLVATTNAPDADISATGRQAATCRACHYDSWFALDKVASVLGKREGMAATATFTPYSGPPQTLLGGLSIGSEKELVTALTRSVAFEFRSCRLAFLFLYGRNEQTCEAPVFDACMQTFKANKTIQSAIKVVASSQAYCQ
jgi:hypothetical protein